MMKPQVQPVRRIPSLALVVIVSALSGAIAGSAVTLFLTPRTKAPAPSVAVVTPPTVRPIPMRTLAVSVSNRTRTIDVMSPGTFSSDGDPDDVYDLAINSDQPIRHIFVIRDDQGLQWDTVIGEESIPYGQVWTGRRGAETWHLGVRENGQWLNSNDGSLQGLGAGHHELELVATSPFGRGPRRIAVMYADGTVEATDVQ